MAREGSHGQKWYCPKQKGGWESETYHLSPGQPMSREPLDSGVSNLYSPYGYSKGKVFDNIQSKPTIDSAFWKYFLSAHEDIQKCVV